MLSYHNDPSLKERAVAAAKRHRDADMLVTGTYGHMNGAFRGCSVGCDAYDITGRIIDDGYHAVTAAHFGFPEWLELLRDAIFEGLPNAERRDFHVQLKEAIPVGVDIEPVRHRLAIRRMNRLIDAQDKALTQANDDIKPAIEKVMIALHQVRRCHEAEIGKGHCGAEDWSAAWSAARSAARSAAWSAESAARSAAWKQEAADLIDLLRLTGTEL
jgi:hypothetical protein